MSSPSAVSSIVIACCVLHNLAVRRGIALDIPDGGDNGPARPLTQPGGQEDEEVIADRGRAYVRGINARQNIVDAFFSHN